MNRFQAADRAENPPAPFGPVWDTAGDAWEYADRMLTKPAWRGAELTVVGWSQTDPVVVPRPLESLGVDAEKGPLPGDESEDAVWTG